MVRSSVLALAVSISLGTLGLTTDAMARGGGFGGGGHFGGGFGGGLAVAAISAAGCVTSAAAAILVAACATSAPRCASPAWTTAGRPKTIAPWKTTAMTTIIRQLLEEHEVRRLELVQRGERDDRLDLGFEHDRENGEALRYRVHDGRADAD